MTDKKYSSLGKIVEAQDAPALREYLAEIPLKSADKETKEKNQEMLDQLLWHACAFDNTEIVEILMDNGADPNYINKGKKAIHNAITSQKIEVIKALVKKNVDIDSPDSQGNTGFLSLFNNEDLEQEQEWGSKPPIDELTKSVLMLAEELVQLKANVDAQNISHKTALHYAASFNNEYLVNFLISHNANPSIECISDNCVPSEYVSETNQDLFDALEDYRQGWQPSSTQPEKESKKRFGFF